MNIGLLFIKENDNYVDGFDTDKLDVNKLNNIIGVDQFNRDNLRLLFKNACTIKNNIKKKW